MNYREIGPDGLITLKPYVDFRDKHTPDPFLRTGRSQLAQERTLQAQATPLLGWGEHRSQRIYARLVP